MGGKGKGKGGPPPPAPVSEEAKAAKAALEQKRRDQAKEEIAQAKELEARQRDLEARLSTLQSHDIAKVPWETAVISTHLSGGKGTADFGDGGSGGVDIFELPGGAAVIVRKGPSIITESIADDVATLLGVRVARMRLVLADSDERRTIKEVASKFSNSATKKHFENMQKQLEHPDTDEETRAHLKKHLNHLAPCAVLEFIPGTSLDTAVSALEACSSGLLVGLGRLCALDLLLNNMDRVPLPCWSNDGNLTNAIITPAGELVGFDQQVNHIKPGPGLDAYLGKVREIAAQVLQGKAPAVAASISGAIKKHTGVELSEESMERVMEGMSDLLRKAVKLSIDGSLAKGLSAAATKAGEASFEEAVFSTKVDPVEIATQDVAFVQKVIDAVADYEMTF